MNSLQLMLISLHTHSILWYKTLVGGMGKFSMTKMRQIFDDEDALGKFSMTISMTKMRGPTKVYTTR